MERPSPHVPEGGPAVPDEANGTTPTNTGSAGRVRLLRRLGSVFHAGAAATAAGVLLLVVAIALVLASGGWASITRFGPSFLTGSVWDGVHNIYGAGPAIVGTLLTSAFALVIAVPIALGVALFLSEIAPRWLRRPLAYVVDLCAAIPSVVYGFWAFIVLVPFMRSVVEPGLSGLTGGAYPFSRHPLGQDIFTATIVLAVMIIPTIAAVSRESLMAVSRIQRESALSLGATRWEATRMAVLGPARSGIFGGIILGLGRALGETIAVTMVIGNIYILPGTLFSPGSTLASWIAGSFGEVGPGLQMSALLELGLILLAITVAVNAVARLILWRTADRSAHGDDTVARVRSPSVWHRLVSRGSSSDRPASLPGTGTPLPVPSSGLPSRAAPTPVEFQRRLRRRHAFQWGMVILAAGCVVLALIPLAGVLTTAVHLGGQAVIRPSFYTSEPPLGCNPVGGQTCSLGGIGPAIQGTLIMLGLGALIAVPVGLMAGIYLSEYGRNRFARAVSFLTDVMTGVPTILIGVFVFVVFLYADHDSALSALSGGVALGVLMIPIVTRATEEALRTVPQAVREAGLALGFPRHRVTLRVVLGCARSALITGILLAASRAAGDTAALIVTAGGSNYWFTNLNSQTAALTPFIYGNFSSAYSNLETDAWGATLVLLLIMLVVSLGARLAVRGPIDSPAGE
ncbi:MAG: phosphate ABC transporter permease subunit PstC [Thermoplasmata archaeon]